MKQIITYYLKNTDLTEQPKELSKNKIIYIYCIIDHFSKYRMAYIIENKEAKTILKYLKIALEYNGFPEEIGSINGKEFKNKLIEDLLNENDIKYKWGSL